MNIFSGCRILVVAAHPDDEILGCGGTLAWAIDCGAIVSVLFLGEGIAARFPYGKTDNKDYMEQSEKRLCESKAAMACLGIEDVNYGTRLCGQFDELPLITIVKDIESHIARVNPDILFTHNSSEVNIDHRITYEAVEVACRPTRDDVPSAIYSFEIICSGGYKIATTFNPNVFIDIEKYWDKKMEAWHCYSGEARPFPFPRSDEGLGMLAGYRGIQSNLKLSEAFKLERLIVK